MHEGNETCAENTEMNTASDRQRQIMEVGCPVCGCEYEIGTDDGHGVLFRCKNQYCPSGRHVVKEEDADAQCPTSDEDLLAIKEFKAAYMRWMQCDLERRFFRDKVRYTRGQATQQQDLIMACKNAYKTVRDLRLFNDKGDRVYSFNNPFVIEDPNGNQISITNIGNKRKAKAMFSALWWDAKMAFNKSLMVIAGYRQELRNRLAELPECLRNLKKALEPLKQKGIKFEYMKEIPE